jgi:hypothetical protein
MAINAQLIAEELISYTVVTDKNSLVRLLERNGIQMPSNPSDKEVTIAVLTASGKSVNFKSELAKLLAEKAPKAGEDFSQFIGDSSDFDIASIDTFNFTGADDFVGFNVASSLSGIGTSVSTATQKPAKQPSTLDLKRQSRITADNPQGKTAAGLFLKNLSDSLTSKETINAGLNIGLTAINNKVQGQNNALQQETNILTQRQDEIRQQLAVTPKKGLSTVTWVLIGLGVVALGTTIYFVAKKKA